MGKTMSFLAGALCGALVGAVAAVLLAPMSGDELQVRAREQFDLLLDDVRDAAQSKRVELEAELARLKNLHGLTDISET